LSAFASQVEEHLSLPLFLERYGTVALVRVREAPSVVLGQRARTPRERVQEGGRSLFLQSSKRPSPNRRSSH